MAGYTDSDREKFIEKALTEGSDVDIINFIFVNPLQTIKYLRDLADKLESGACRVDEASASINKHTLQHSFNVKLTDTK